MIKPVKFIAIFCIVIGSFFITNPLIAESDPNITKEVLLGAQQFDKKLYKESFKTLYPIAQQGNFYAEFYIGIMHYYGVGTQLDKNLGLTYLMKSAKSDYIQSQLTLAELAYHSGAYNQIQQWLDMAEKQTKGDALYSLGDFYYGNRLGQPSYKKAIRAFERSAEAGNLRGYTALGYMYANGKGVTKDTKKSVAYYEKAAAKKDAFANYHLGTLYREGRFVTKNRIKSLTYFLAGAEAGSLPSAYALGQSYETGWEAGNKDDLIEGMKWLQVSMVLKTSREFYRYSRLFKSALAYASKSNVNDANGRAISWYKETFDIDPPENLYMGKVKTVTCNEKSNKDNPDCDWSYYTQFKGQAVYGIPHGEGKMTTSKYSYNGNFAAGNKSGHGTYTTKDSTYVGQFKDDKKHGQGTLTEGEYKAVGEFRYNSFRTGKVTNKRDSNGTYTGAMKNSEKNGKGSYIWRKSGNKYVGDYVNSERTGQGKFFYKMGGRYEGSFKKNKFHGKGIIYWKGGDRYNGDWKDNKRSGKGTYFWIGGNRHEGYFVDNLIKGNGTRYFKSGGYCRGRWNGKNVYDGRGKYKSSGKTVDCYWRESKNTYWFGRE